ncbi:type IX secretion system membrane protein PorP/SprF [Flavobacteriaceae bacterium F08102]|nr:type IX secretion system membrane protein PorP/SprF [Flavobacteriaceae bacterium F08102]
MKNYLTILFCFCVFFVKAQELKLTPYSQYLVENPFVISPAFAGVDEEVYKLRISGVAQWLGLSNAPSTQTLSFDTRLDENSGVGIIMYNDKNGHTKQIGGQLTYAYHLELNYDKYEFLSFGLSYKFNQFSIDTDDFDDGSGNGHNDPHVGAGQKMSNHNFEVGALYRLDRFFVAINASNILNKKISIFEGDEPTKLRNYYFYTGYSFLSRSEEYEYEPSIYFKYFEGDGRSATDLNFKARMLVDDGYFWAGINTRFINDQSFEPVSISPLIGMNKKKFYVGYGFQLNINEAKTFNNSGTHLITLGYNFDNGKYSTSWSNNN